MKVISTLQVSPTFLKELRPAMARKKKKRLVPAGRRNVVTRFASTNLSPFYVVLQAER